MNNSKTNLAGQKFTRLRTLASPYKTTLGLTVNCMCSCGSELTVLVRHLHSGKVRSCGCLARQVSALLSQTAADGSLKRSHRREYNAHMSAQQRSLNPKSYHYAVCGGAGIGFHPAWIGDFPRFIKDLGPAKPNQILLRKDLRGDFRTRTGS